LSKLGADCYLCGIGVRISVRRSRIRASKWKKTSARMRSTVGSAPRQIIFLSLMS